jgi:2'-5' RNA ligase
MENFHITLSFLGQVPPDKMERLEQKLTQIQAQALRLSNSRLGSFIKAKILYLGIHQDLELSQLAKQCLSINSALGLPQHHQAYRPHITLTRKHKEVVPIVAPPASLYELSNQMAQSSGYFEQLLQ